MMLDGRKTSQYKGVQWHEPTSKWRSQIAILRVQYRIGHYDNEAEAAQDYNKVEQAKGDIVRETSLIPDVAEQKEHVRKCIREAVGKGDISKLSKLKGVSWDDSAGKWSANLAINQEILFVGHYDRENDAGRSLEKLYQQLHVIQEDLAAEPDPEVRQLRWAVRRDEILAQDLIPTEKVSKHKGVTKNGRDGWRAQLRLDGMIYSIRTHTGPGGEERAMDDYYAIYPHKRTMVAELKGIPVGDERRYWVQEYWSRVVGCNAPRRRKRAAGPAAKEKKLSKKSKLDNVEIAEVDKGVGPVTAEMVLAMEMEKEVERGEENEVEREVERGVEKGGDNEAGKEAEKEMEKVEGMLVNEVEPNESTGDLVELCVV